jgi:hypothetical protein
MGRLIWIAMVGALVASCGSFDGAVPGDPAREVLGVSAHQPGSSAAPTVDGDTARKLDWKVSQLCTGGYVGRAQALEPAENDQLLVDWKLRCRPYELSIFGVSVAGLAPQPF